MDAMVEHDVLPEYVLDPMEIKSYKEEGWLLLPNMLDAMSTEAARGNVREILHGFGTSDVELKQAAGVQSKLLQTGQYLNGTTIDRLVNSERLNSVAAQLLGGEANLYFSFTAVKSGGGGGKFHFHQDNNYTQFTDGLSGINIWFALVDMTPENGCLCIQPRSHLDGTLTSENAGQGDGHRSLGDDIGTYLPVRMRAGDAVAFSRLTVHGSGANKTRDPRFGYSIHYYRDDVMARWDGQEPRRLKEHPRWDTSGVDKITRDGNVVEPN